MKLLVATTNRGKVREITGILAGVPVELVGLDAYPGVPEADETGRTFAENARLKALHYAAATGLPSVAEDSGLEVDALDKAPGVHSARWMGSDYAVKFRAIYDLLGERDVQGGRARFVCALAFANGERIEYETQGVVEGEIAPEPRGTNGFGYDPIFFYPPYGRTLAEVDDEAKAAVSHRGSAFRAFREYLLALTRR